MRIIKSVLPLLLGLFLFSGVFASDTTLIYRFNIHEEIAPPAWRTVQKAIDQAHQINADLIFIDLNTYGGLVYVADSIRTRILRTKIPIFVLIEDNAASAGAFISIACDSIFMKPGSTIGAVTVVDQSGAQLPDKYQSYMRSRMRATAEEKGRDPDIAEAMVDPDKVVPGISDSGKVITFTVKEALKYGFCDAEVSSMEEALKHSGIAEYKVVEHQMSSIDDIIGFLISPAISGILIMIIIGGIYFELQSPGVGFPIIAALIAALMYFAPHYLQGMADNWEILIFIVGLVLIAVEVFVIPGFGVAGILGISLTVSGLALSMVGNVGFDFSWVNGQAIVQSFLIVIIATVVSITGSIYLAMRLLKTNLLSNVVLNSIQSKTEGYISADPQEFDLVGKHGVAATVLRPSGKIEIEGEWYDATAETGFIEQGEKVEVVKYETAQLFVQKV